MKRNASIELYRCALMFGIVVLHCAGCGAERVTWLANLLKFCVTGFVFISGYFGIRFSWRKLLALYGMALYCAAVSAVIHYYQSSDGAILSNAFLYMKRYWFLHAYAILMMISPVLNLTFEKDSKSLRGMLLPLLVLVFGWSYCYEIGHIRPYVFYADGLGAHTPLTLIGVYMVARWFCVSRAEAQIRTWYAVVALLICIPVAVVGLAPYNSIFAMALAASLFLIFKRTDIACAWICWVSPSMFSVYCLHATEPGMSFLTQGGGDLVVVLCNILCLYRDRYVSPHSFNDVSKIL